MAQSHQGVEAIANIPVDQVRTALRRTMVLGMPENSAERPTFYFERVVDWALHDREGQPWDWTTAPISESQKASVQALCSWEFFAPLGRQGAFFTPVGEFAPSTVVFTFLEDEFRQVEGFSYAQIGPVDRRWYFRFWRPAAGLGTMTVYEVHCISEGVA